MLQNPSVLVCLRFTHGETEVLDAGEDGHRAGVPFSKHPIRGHTKATLTVTNEVYTLIV